MPPRRVWRDAALSRGRAGARGSGLAAPLPRRPARHSGRQQRHRAALRLPDGPRRRGARASLGRRRPRRDQQSGQQQPRCGARGAGPSEP
eukprot:scaffold37736_cov51-Phaeocystis_antarctica.AAC.1